MKSLWFHIIPSEIPFLSYHWTNPFSMGPYFISSFINLLLAINDKVYTKALVYEKRTIGTEFSKNNRKFQRNWARPARSPRHSPPYFLKVKAWRQGCPHGSICSWLKLTIPFALFPFLRQFVCEVLQFLLPLCRLVLWACRSHNE